MEKSPTRARFKQEKSLGPWLWKPIVKPMHRLQLKSETPQSLVRARDFRISFCRARTRDPYLRRVFTTATPAEGKKPLDPRKLSGIWMLCWYRVSAYFYMALTTAIVLEIRRGENLRSQNRPSKTRRGAAESGFAGPVLGPWIEPSLISY